MLRRNIDVTVGLVNGAIGTGLSLDAAIIDLSTDVFGDGMAYVALSHSNRPKKSKICDNNALNKPRPQKRKVDVDSSTDNTALVLPRSRKDDKLIVSINLKDLKTKFNVKDDDSCSSLIVSIKLSNIKCKPKDDKTKCVVKNDHCSSSSLIVSIKLSSIKLKTSNPKRDDVIFTYEESPNPDILLESYLVVQQQPLSNERVPNSTLDVPGDGNCLFYALSYLITGSISQHYELRKAIVRTTIYSYSLTPTFVGWARYGTQTLYGIPCDTNTPALYLKHVGTNAINAVRITFCCKYICTIMELQGIQKFHVLDESYHTAGGACIGGSTGAPPGGSTGAPPGGSTGAPPGGSTGAPPGGSTGAPPGRSTGAPPGGSTGAPPGGSTGATIGVSTGGPPALRSGMGSAGGGGGGGGLPSPATGGGG
uniref:OTU domain-containing protein n=1 Tax=Amphimedon queenslandica TaxID=400682 RepID=A0A1X7UP31_AMPQE